MHRDNPTGVGIPVDLREREATIWKVDDAAATSTKRAGRRK